MKSKVNNCIYCFICLVLWLGLTSCRCGISQNGFSLQRFKIIDERLGATIKGISDSSFILKKKNEVIVLMLNIVESVPVFSFTSAPQNKINEYYIFSSNSRIIGYIEDKMLPTEVIVLSNINSRVDFEFAFYKFIVPTLVKKRFDYIFFPDDQYVVDKKGHGTPPPFFDPIYYRFEYRNNKIVPMTK